MTNEQNETVGLRPKNAAKALGISDRKLADLMADKSTGFPFAKLGGTVVIPIDGLKSWLADQAASKGGAA